MTNLEYKQNFHCPVAKRNEDELRPVKTKGNIGIFQDSFDRYHFMYFNESDEAQWLHPYSDSAKEFKLVEDLIIFIDRDGYSRIINSQNGQWIAKAENGKFVKVDLFYQSNWDQYLLEGYLSKDEKYVKQLFSLGELENDEEN